MALSIVFLSYDEPNADKHWKILEESFPYAIRVHGVKGIREAHIAASKAAMTSSFFVIDADSLITPSASDVFNFKPSEWDKNYVHIWNSINGANGLIYGYGGIKLFNKSMFQNIDTTSSYVDFSTKTTLGKGAKFMGGPPPTINYFNSSEEKSWKGAFREVSKLMLATTIQSEDPLVLKDKEIAEIRCQVWSTAVSPTSSFGYAVVNGASTAKKFVLENNFQNLHLINDPDWLHQQYESRKYFIE